MQHKIYPAARRQNIEIWFYTHKTWGEKQADKYIRGLYDAIKKAAGNKYLWRKVEHENLKGIFYERYEQHYVLFRELSKNMLGVVSVLHESMDIPNRLKDNLYE